MFNILFQHPAAGPAIPAVGETVMQRRQRVVQLIQSRPDTPLPPRLPHNTRGCVCNSGRIDSCDGFTHHIQSASLSYEQNRAGRVGQSRAEPGRAEPRRAALGRTTPAGVFATQAGSTGVTGSPGTFGQPA
jgi:hypothetical protein